MDRRGDLKVRPAKNTKRRRVEGNKKSEQQGTQIEEEWRGTRSQNSREYIENGQKRGLRSQNSREYKENEQ